MVMNKQKGNMYNWCDFTWNPIKGKCPHQCSYCYMNRFPVGELRLDEKCLKDNLGKGNTIFVGSSTDMFAEKVPADWIERVLLHCNFNQHNTFLFQTKNPSRFKEFMYQFPNKTILGTTIETNRSTEKISKAPGVLERMNIMKDLSKDFKIMISIEPVMDFDLNTMVRIIWNIKPKFVSIGADSQNSNLPEPSPEKVRGLIKELKKLKFTEVKIKDNLKRLLDE